MKKMVIAKYIEALEESLASARKCYEVAKHDTIEAEGRMVTRYDSTKTETAWLADGYLKNVKELEHVIKSLQGNSKFVDVGTTVRIDIYRLNAYLESRQVIVDKELMKLDQELFVSLLGLANDDRFGIKVDGQLSEGFVREIDNVETCEGVRINCLVLVADEDGYQDYFYIVKDFGGTEIDVDGRKVFCVSKQAPMAIALLTHVVGESIKMNGISFTVKSIE